MYYYKTPTLSTVVVVVVGIFLGHTVSGETVVQKYEYSAAWFANVSSETINFKVERASVWKKGEDEVVLYTLTPTNERFLVHVSDSAKIVAIYFEGDKPHKNLLKGIASLFLYKTTPWEGWQRDVSGDCYVRYKTKNENRMLRLKDECLSEDTMKHKLHDESGSTEWSSETLIDLKKDKSILKVELVENLVKRDPLMGDYEIESRQDIMLSEYDFIDDVVPEDKYLTVKEVIDAVAKKYKTSFVGEDIATPPDSKRKFKPTQLVALKSKLKYNSLATPEGAKAFISAVKIMRNIDEKTAVSFLKDKLNKNILPQIMDVFGSIHTIDTFKAVLSVFKPESTNNKLLERFIWALSSVEHFWTPKIHHSVQISSELFQHIQHSKFSSESLKESFINSLSLICNNIKSNEEYLNWFLDSFSKCAEEECFLKYMRVLRNIDYAQQEKLGENVLSMANNVLKSDKASKRMKTEAIKLIDSILPELNEEIKTILMTIFINPGEDNSVRISSFEALIENNPNAQLLGEILDNLIADSELTSYVVNKLQSNPKSKRILGELIASGHWNWDVLSTNGQSLSYFEKGKYFSTNFGLELSTNKILKESYLHVSLPNISDFLKMELSTGGLSGFIADKPDPNDDSNAHLSVQLSLLSVPLRPFHLFSSMSELTSLYWSGSMETKQSLLAFNRYIYDSVSVHVFSSGLHFESQLKGALSMDISGSVIVSLFSQTADSSISSGFGFYLKRSLVGIWKEETLISNIHEGSGKVVLDMEGDIRFDGRSCIKMMLQPVDFKEKTSTLSKNHKLGKVTTKENSKDINIPGQTLSLHQKISQLCNEVS
uniref:Vitellogenin domain-containing protein n=1 Tax=Lepeophtheirus salmonis TaxID=72036 RepID=A0A0K2UIS3_LEPSM